MVGTANSATGPFTTQDLNVNSLRFSEGKQLVVFQVDDEPTPTHVTFFAMTPEACKEDIARYDLRMLVCLYVFELSLMKVAQYLYEYPISKICVFLLYTYT